MQAPRPEQIWQSLCLPGALFSTLALHLWIGKHLGWLLRFGLQVLPQCLLRRLIFRCLVFRCLVFRLIQLPGCQGPAHWLAALALAQAVR